MPARARAPFLSFAAVIALTGAAHAQMGTGNAGLMAVIGQAQAAAARDDCAGVLTALDPVVPSLAEGPERLLVQRMRLVCLGTEGRASELGPVQRELALAMPRDGLVGQLSKTSPRESA